MRRATRVHDLTIPVDEIKDIRPVMTMAGGCVVYEATAPAAATSTR